MNTVRSITIGIWIKTGSRNESKQMNGISHFIEHMLFKGTKKYHAKYIAEAFDAIGGEINAFTSKEYTCLYAKVLDEHIDVAMDILADMVMHSVFDENEIMREKKVILEEISMTEDTPDDIIHDYLATSTYQHHPLSYPILGTKDTITHFSQNDLFAFYKQHYQPENMVISIVGNIEASFIYEIEKLFTFNEVESTSQNVTKPIFFPETVSKRKDTEQSHLCLGFEGVNAKSDQIYPLLIFNNILGGSMSSRLFQEIREEHGMAYTIYSFHSAFIDSGLLTIYAGTSPNQLEMVREMINRILEDIMANGITNKEFTNSKQQLKGMYLMSLESTNSKMSRNARNELLLKNHDTMEDVIQDIDQVEITEIVDLIDRLSLSRPSSAVIIPK